jgi:hypothetical protein
VVEDALHVRLDLLRRAAPGFRSRGVRAGERVQEGALVVVEAQDARERREHRGRGPDPALLEPRVVVRRDGCQLRDLFAAKTGDPPLSPTLRQLDIARAQLGAASAKKRTKLVLIGIPAAHQAAALSLRRSRS